MKARLFVCSTQFQIIAILCLMKNQSQDFTKKDNDVVLELAVPHGDAWAKVLRQSGFFRHVYVLTERVQSDFLSMPKRVLLSRVLRGKIRISWNQCLHTIFNKAEDYIKGEIERCNSGKLSFSPSEYDEYFVASFTTLGIVMKRLFQRFNTKTFIFDEGVGTYVGCVWEKHVEPEAIFLFDPDLIDTKFETRKIDSVLNLTGTHLLETIRRELEITSESFPDFIFFDQPSGMPCLYDSHTYEGWQQSDFITKKENLLKAIEACVGEKQFNVKLHPASCNQEVFDFYKHEKLSLLNTNSGVPFELLLTVATKKPKCLITIFSSAVITPLTLGIDRNMKVILLWELFKNDRALEFFNRNGAISDFFENVRRKYPNNVYIPKNKADLIEILSSDN